MLFLTIMFKEIDDKKRRLGFQTNRKTAKQTSGLEGVAEVSVQGRCEYVFLYGVWNEGMAETKSILQEVCMRRKNYRGSLGRQVLTYGKEKEAANF
jgi:hypothetical protein